MKKNQMITIVMYHYVRPILNSKYPGIKGLELKSFQRQLDYLQENYSIVNSKEIVDAIIKKKSLPQNACWLTFDDGFKDNINYVMPELLARKLSGTFFPPEAAIRKSIMLDVHSIHHILSCVKDIDKIFQDVNILSKQNGISDKQINSYYKNFGRTSRYDDAKTIYVKRMLQRILPEKIRNNIVKELFKKYLGISQEEFSKKLYMSTQDVSKLLKNGMSVGSHGSMHYWLDEISYQKQKEDILTSLEFLEEVGAPTSNWIMCYPYGAYNNDTLSLVKELGAIIGVTTKVGKADLSTDNPFTLSRFDTNDFPQ
jgi:peptidoglycan/xylan/chitin deacetylase (PgdA/CDA1 family)